MLIPTLHPSAVLRNGGAALAQARADFVRRRSGRSRGARTGDDHDSVDRTQSPTRRSLAARIGASLRAGDVVVLAGELGTGKTVFAKGIAVRARRRPNPS